MRQRKQQPGGIDGNEDKESSPQGKTRPFPWQALSSSGLHMCPSYVPPPYFIITLVSYWENHGQRHKGTELPANKWELNPKDNDLSLRALFF